MSAIRTAVALALLALPLWAAAETHVVTMEGMGFSPATLTVRPGDKVVWRNRDVVPHTATAEGSFHSGLVAPGKSWTWTARARASGSLDYVCVYHPGMKARLVVQ